MEKITLKDFESIESLGFGSFGIVSLVRKKAHHQDKREYALKYVKNAQDKKVYALAKTERDNMIKMDSPFVVKLFYTFFSAKTAHFIMEYCSGGSLVELVSNKGPLRQEHARFYLAELLIALEHLKAQEIVHRDLKLENVMMQGNGHIKIIDFGLSVKLEGSEKCFKTSGTMSCQAPEIHKREGHDTRADMWSYGVIMFDLLTAAYAFNCKDREATIEKIKNIVVSFPQYLSQEAKNLMKKIFTREDVRITCSEVRAHDFFEGICWDTVAACGLTPPFVIEGEERSTAKGRKLTQEKVQNQEVEDRINDEFYYARP